MARAYGPGSYDASYERQGHDYPLPYVRWTENRNMEEFLRLAAQESLQIEALITHRFPLEDAPKAYEIIMDPGTEQPGRSAQVSAAVCTDPVAAYQPRRKVEVNRAAAALHEMRRRPGRRRQSGSLGSSCRILRTPLACACAPFSRAAAPAPRVTRCALERNIARRTTTKFLATPPFTVVVIVSRNPQHAAQALAALRAGKHVFVEKPMALTEQECLDLYQAVQEIRKAADGGIQSTLCAQLSAAEATNCETLPLRQSLNCRINSPGISGSYWMADPAIGGAILGEACHFVDLMYWLLDSEPIEVFASSLPTGKKDPIGENNMVATFSIRRRLHRQPDLLHGGQPHLGRRARGGFCSRSRSSAENFKNPWSAPVWYARVRVGSRRKDTKTRCSLSSPPFDLANSGHHRSRRCALDSRVPAHAAVRARALAVFPRSRPVSRLIRPTMRVLLLGPYPPPHGGVQTNLVAHPHFPAETWRALRRHQYHSPPQGRRR